MKKLIIALLLINSSAFAAAGECLLNARNSMQVVQLLMRANKVEINYPGASVVTHNSRSEMTIQISRVRTEGWAVRINTDQVFISDMSTIKIEGRKLSDLINCKEPNTGF